MMEIEAATGSGQALHLLSNGGYSVLLSAAGGGYAAYRGLALTRWTADPTLDGEGFFVYVRDLESRARWSATLQPLKTLPEHYATSFGGGRASFTREDGGIQMRTEVCVAADDDVELRRLLLTNRGPKPRHLELTTYLEVVLNGLAADAAHPAFSKLFVQTRFLPELGALLAWRRLRSPEETPLYLGHRLQLEGADRAAGELEYETDRRRFVGRGRSLADPLALLSGDRLSGSVGNVLDPIFSLRRAVHLEPGESLELAAVLAAGPSEAAVVERLRRFERSDAVRAALRDARPAPDEAERALELPQRWAVGSFLAAGGGARPRHASRWRPRDAGEAARHEAGRPPASADGEREPLLHFNGHGGFARNGREYVIRLEPGPHGLAWPPLPWINVVANEEIGFLASESGAGYTWSQNSRENRLTPWSNDPVTDVPGEALYLRDEESGAIWSPLPAPLAAPVPYEVRHGFGYSLYRSASHELEQEVRLFVPRRDPLKIARLQLTNRSARRRRLSLFSYLQWVLGGTPADTRGAVLTTFDERAAAVLARNSGRREFAHRVAFAAVRTPETGQVDFTTDRAEFLGRLGSVGEPAAVHTRTPLSGHVGQPADACAAFRLSLELEPGETAVCLVLLGEAESATDARIVLDRYRSVAAADAALAEVRAFWDHIAGAVQVQTPSAAIDLMVNGWLTYQNLACRMWARSAFYQSGGAFGFRDQLQDSSALLYVQPALTREQILLHAGHQFPEGDVLHWWHPPLSKGIRTRFSDDLLWLPYVTAFYLAATGDTSLLDEAVPFLTAPALPPGEDEVFLEPEDSGRRASLYEHCCLALDRSLTRGAHGLPLIGSGDWNDGMNRVGREGRGESVWLGFFLFDILSDWLPICEQRGDEERLRRYGEYRSALHATLNAEGAGWDGGWYRRAYYDDGAPLGAAENEECRIDMIAQAWAVLSRAAPPERAAQALDAMEEHLVSEEAAIMRLLTPAFDRTPHDPGYIKGYLPGVRENGGQYTHGALWGVRALAALGRADRAARLLEMLSPVSHARSEDEVTVYQTEPYVVAADVYGVAPHVGRGGWTWYTGSAGWMFRVAVESILGLELRGGEALALRPCIPDEWPGFVLRYQLPDGRTAYRFEVRNRRREATATRASLDGTPCSVESGAVIVPVIRDGEEHVVEITLGADVGPRYEPRSASSSAPPLERITSR